MKFKWYKISQHHEIYGNHCKRLFLWVQLHLKQICSFKRNNLSIQSIAYTQWELENANFRNEKGKHWKIKDENNVVIPYVTIF